MTDETHANDGDADLTCPKCSAEIRLDASFSATEFACPSCGCTLTLENGPGDVTVVTEDQTIAEADNTLPADADKTIDAAGDRPKTISAFLTETGIQAEHVDLKDGGLTGQGPGDERYAIGEELARGGMGAVLSAKDLNLRRDVAMKIVLNPQAAKDRQIVRFVHEAQVTGQLEHPSIVPVYELGVDEDDHVYYTMKFIRGTNLGDVIAGLREGDAALRETYPLNRLLDIFIKACDALAFAHTRGVIHRDLKPDNIMVGDFGEVLIVDWGLAKVLGKKDAGFGMRDSGENESEETAEWAVESIRDGSSGKAYRTLQGSVMGTPAYMSPEQAAGDVEGMGPEADIYTMGGILYALLTLEAPVQGENLDAILAKVAAGDITPPEQHTGEHPHCPEGKVPSPLSSVVMKAMAMEPEDRYPTVQALQADIQAYLDGFATSAEEAGAWRLLKLFIARHRAMFISFVVANAALMLVVGIAYVVNLQARHAAEAARIEADRARIDADTARGQAEVARGEADTARGEAESSLAAYKKEQARGIALRRTAAPAMLRAAHRLIENGDLAGASLQMVLAREYDPKLSAAHLLAAQLFIVQEEFDAAIDALNTFLKHVPGDAPAQQLLNLCREKKTDRTDAERAVVFMKVFSSQGASRLADQIKIRQERLFKTQVERAMAAWVKQPGRKMFSRMPNGLIFADLQRSKITDLSPLQGMPLGGLLLIECGGLSDLSGLKGLPIRSLDLRDTGVSDLSPLSGAPLKKLILASSKVTDLGPLAGVPLRDLDLRRCPVSDLSPLKGMPLKRLILWRTYKAADISALAGMPLRELDLELSGAKDLSPLASCSSLRILRIGGTKAKDLEGLRGLKLETLVLGAGDLDLAPLAGMPLKSLKLETKAKSLEMLAGMPLEELTLKAPAVTDLSFLKGMPLRSLKLEGMRKLGDLEGLRGAPLTELRMRECPQISDIEVLRSLTSLETLVVPDQFKTIDVLDALPHITRAGNTRKDFDSPPNLKTFLKRQGESP